MMFPVTVLHVDTERTWRGGEAQVFQLACRQDRNRFLPVVAAPVKSPLLEKCAAAKIDVLPLSGTGEFSPGLIGGLLRGIVRIKPRIVHVHTSHGLLAAAFVKKVLSGDIRIIYSRRTDFHLRTKFFGLSRKKYEWGADCILSVSDAIKQVLIEDGIPADKIKTVYSGIDVNAFDTTLDGCRFRQELGVNKEQPLIGMIAALAPHKDPLNFIKASERVITRFPDAVFVLAGAGKLWDSLNEYLTKSDLGTHFRMLGFRSDIQQILAALDIFCMTSKEEGLCTSILDAMAMKKVVVATRAGGIPEAVEHGKTGFIVEPQDPSSLSIVLCELIQNPEKRLMMGEAGRQRVETLFAIQKTVTETEKVYNALLEADER